MVMPHLPSRVLVPQRSDDDPLDLIEGDVVAVAVVYHGGCEGLSWAAISSAYSSWPPLASSAVLAGGPEGVAGEGREGRLAICVTIELVDAEGRAR